MTNLQSSEEKQMESQYDEFAVDYEWIFSDFVERGEQHYDNLKPVLGKLPENPRILDCACGTGIAALAIARHGYNVTGTDASKGMVTRAKQHAAEEDVDVLFSVCVWDELPEQFDQEFDLALCCGNSIGHCRDKSEMIRSLQSIHKVMKPGGLLIVDTRNWEKLLAERIRFTNFGPRERNGQRCIPIYVWTFPETKDGPVLVEVVLPIEADGKVSLKTYPITYYPFGLEGILDRMKSAGFVDVETDYSEDKTGYHVTGRRF